VMLAVIRQVMKIATMTKNHGEYLVSLGRISCLFNALLPSSFVTFLHPSPLMLTSSYL